MGLFDNMEVVSSFAPSDKINKDLPTLAFTDGSTITTPNTYDSFGFPILSNNSTFNGALEFDTRVKEANLTQKDLSSFTAKEFSDFVELGILPKTKTNRDINISNLVQPIEDVQFSQSSLSPSSTNLISVIKDVGKNQNDINSKILDVLNHATSLHQNANQLLLDQNKILLEKNRILESKYHTDLSHQKIISESAVLSAQMLGYIPALIEAITIGNKNKIEVDNIANSHRYQKNVNDAYAFNYNKDDENGIKAQLGGIVNNLAASASHQGAIKTSIDGVKTSLNTSNENQVAIKTLIDGVKTSLNTSNENQGAIKASIDGVKTSLNTSNENQVLIKTILDGSKTALEESATAHTSMVEPIKNQGDYALEEKKIIDEENSPETKSFFEDVYDMFIGAVDGELDEFNIFEWLLKNTTQAGKK